jgi:pimeloyl-ACP methyl ester carboxylesterase
MDEAIDTGDVELWTERRGQGPDVLLIAGLGDPAEAWQPQLDGLSDRYLVTAFDNRGVGRTPLPEGRLLSASTMADDDAALLRALEVPSSHVVGFSMGSAIAQELALGHPELVRSLVLVSTYALPDALWRSQLNFWRWLVEVAPSERAFFEAFFTWVYTPRPRGRHGGSTRRGGAYLPHKQSVEAFQAQVDVCLAIDTVDRLPEIAAPTLVLSGELDIILPPRIGRPVAAEITNARFEVMPGEAHQPFQEVPDEFNARVEAFWREVEARG